MMNTKVMAGLFFTGTLVAGLAAGILIDRTLLRPEPPIPVDRHRPFAGAPGSGEPMLHIFARDLELTAAQHDELARILESYRQRFGALRHAMHPRFSAVRDSLNTEIRALLTPEQQRKFDEMLRRFEAMRKRAGHEP